MTELELVHDAAYIEAVRAGRPGRPGQRPGTGSAPPTTRSSPACTRRPRWWPGPRSPRPGAVWRGEAGHAANIAGGLHHAMRRSASGFCVYNDPAIAIRWLLAQGAERIAYVDLDVHHGDGVQAAFYDDPRVLTISLHEHPRHPVPRHRAGVGDRFGRRARGYAVNVALPAGTGDAGWLRAFDAVVPPLLRAFAPEVLVSQHGCDSHRLDPLAHLELSVDAQRRAQLDGARAGARDRRRPVAAHRRRRIRAGASGAAIVDPPARRGRGRPDRPRPADAGGLAGTGASSGPVKARPRG